MDDLEQIITKCKADIILKHHCPATNKDIAIAIRSWMKGKINKCPYTYKLEKGYYPKDIKQALGLEG